MVKSITMRQLPARRHHSSRARLPQISRRGSRCREVAASLVEAPLTARIANKLLRDKHVSGAVGAADRDPVGRAVMIGAREIEFTDLFLVHALCRTVGEHSLTTVHIVSWAARTKLFEVLSTGSRWTT